MSAKAGKRIRQKIRSWKLPGRSDNFRDAMRARLEQFALELHGEKTRSLEFGRRAAARRRQGGLGRPETFAFLGFTFISGSRREAFLLHRKTRRDRMHVTLREIKGELRRRMHRPIPEQGRWLRAVVTRVLRLPERSSIPAMTPLMRESSGGR